jgi:hypothetical protein
MGYIIPFVPKSELERARLIREAREIYDSIFPPTRAVSEQQDARPTQAAQAGASDPIHFGKVRSRANDNTQVP